MKKLLFILLVIITLVSVSVVQAAHSSCPCEEPFRGPTYEVIQAMAQACYDCTQMSDQEHLEEAQRPAEREDTPSGLGDYEHSLSEEIERLNKLRRKQKLQAIKARQISEAKSTVRFQLDALENLQLTEESYKDLLSNIDALIYKDKFADRAALESLKDEVTEAYEKQEAMLEKIRAKQEAEAREERKQEVKERGIDFIISEANKGRVPPSLYDFINTLNAKQSLDAKDLSKLKSSMGIVMQAVGKLLEANGDRQVIAELLLAAGDIARLERGDKAKYTVKDQEARSKDLFKEWNLDDALTERRADINKYKRRESKQLDAATAERLRQGKQELLHIRALEDAYTIYEKKSQLEGELQGKPSAETEKKRWELYSALIKRQVDLLVDYREIVRKYPYDVEANFAISEILTFQGRNEEAQYFRHNALIQANEQQFKQIDAAMVERFQNSLQLHSRPTSENSVFIQRMGTDFENKHFPETIKQESNFDRIRKLEAVRIAEEWLFEKTKPLRTLRREWVEEYEDKKKYLDPQQVVEERIEEIQEGLMN